MVEKRSAPRVTFERVVITDQQGLVFKAKGENVSIGGMCLVLPQNAPAPGVFEEYDLSFHLPHVDGPVLVRAVVRWIDKDNPLRCGVQFLQGLRAIEVYALTKLAEGVK